MGGLPQLPLPNPPTPKPPTLPIPFDDFGQIIGGAKGTPPMPPIAAPLATPQEDLTPADLKTPQPDLTPAPLSTPDEGPVEPTREGVLTPDALKQQLIDAGFDEAGAATILGEAGAMKMSPERIAQLLQVRMGHWEPGQAPYDDQSTYSARVRAVRELMTKVMSDPRLDDAYTRGLSGINAVMGDLGPTLEDKLTGGHHKGSTHEIEIFAMDRRAKEAQNPESRWYGGAASTHKILAHEIGHNISERMFGNSAMPAGWAAAVQLDEDHLDAMRDGSKPVDRRLNPGVFGPGSTTEYSKTRPWISAYAKGGQNLGSALAEDFADSVEQYLHELPETRAAFRGMYPARAAVLDAVLGAMKNPDKAFEQLGLQPDPKDPESVVFDRGSYGKTVTSRDAAVGTVSANRKLLNLEMQRLQAVAKDPAADPMDREWAQAQIRVWKDTRGDLNETYSAGKDLEANVRDERIKEALESWRKGGYRSAIGKLQDEDVREGVAGLDFQAEQALDPEALQQEALRIAAQRGWAPIRAVPLDELGKRFLLLFDTSEPAPVPEP